MNRKKAYEKSILDDMGITPPNPIIPPGKTFCPHCGENVEVFIKLGISTRIEKLVLMPKGTQPPS